MAEGRPETEQEFREAFARIEAAVDAGNTDLVESGFWRLVGVVKREPALVDRWAEQIGRIDRKAFVARARFRVPVWVGNSALVAGVVAGAFAVVVALQVTSHVVAGLALLAAAGAWTVATHDLAHWTVGRLVGIRFDSYFLSRAVPPPRPGLKTDYASYVRADPNGRVVMHAAGAIASKLAPFVALAFAPAAHAPWWSVLLLGAIGVGAIVTDLLFSVRLSDWKRVKRERAVARARAGS